MARDFSRRSAEPELMDGESDFPTFRDCLRDLAQVNVVTLAHRPTLAFLEQLRCGGRLALGRPVEIADIGSGYGDLLRAIRRWAAARDVPVRLVGVDINPWSAQAARAAPGGDGIEWVTGDVFARDRPCDVAVSSLFTHHLSDAEVVGFLRWMEQAARLGWFVNDLHRHPVAYFGFSALARIAGWHPFVRHDGPVSIARAFVVQDWLALLDRAEVAGAGVRRCFPFRLCVSRVNP